MNKLAIIGCLSTFRANSIKGQLNWPGHMSPTFILHLSLSPRWAIMAHSCRGSKWLLIEWTEREEKKMREIKARIKLTTIKQILVRKSGRGFEGGKMEIKLNRFDVLFREKQGKGWWVTQLLQLSKWHLIIKLYYQFWNLSDSRLGLANIKSLYLPKMWPKWPIKNKKQQKWKLKMQSH